MSGEYSEKLVHLTAHTCPGFYTMLQYVTVVTDAHPFTSDMCFNASYADLQRHAPLCPAFLSEIQYPPSDSKWKHRVKDKVEDDRSVYFYKGNASEKI